MAWIESHQSLRNHRKTLTMARALGASKLEVIGSLHCLWWWALDNAPDGLISQSDVALLPVAAEWRGIADDFNHALVVAGFVDVTPDGYLLHDWSDYAGKLIDRRQRNAEQMRRTRARNSDNTSTSREQHVLNTSSSRGANVVNTSTSREQHVVTRVNLPDPTGPNPTGPDHVGVCVVPDDRGLRVVEESDSSPNGTTHTQIEERATEGTDPASPMREALRQLYFKDQRPTDHEARQLAEEADYLSATDIPPTTDDLRRLQSVIHEAFPRYTSVPMYVLKKYTSLWKPRQMVAAVLPPEEPHGPEASPEVAQENLEKIRRLIGKTTLAKRIGGSPAEPTGPEIDEPAVVARRLANRADFLRQAGVYQEPGEKE